MYVDDAAFDAVLLARAVPGRPVHVRWRRADELSWAPFGSPMAVDVDGGGNAYVTGATNASAYPATDGAHQAELGDLVHQVLHLAVERDDSSH